MRNCRGLILTLAIIEVTAGLHPQWPLHRQQRIDQLMRALLSPNIKLENTRIQLLHHLSG